MVDAEYIHNNTHVETRTEHMTEPTDENTEVEMTLPSAFANVSSEAIRKLPSQTNQFNSAARFH